MTKTRYMGAGPGLEPGVYHHERYVLTNYTTPPEKPDPGIEPGHPVGRVTVHYQA